MNKVQILVISTHFHIITFKTLFYRSKLSVLVECMFKDPFQMCFHSKKKYFSVNEQAGAEFLPYDTATLYGSPAVDETLVNIAKFSSNWQLKFQLN